MPRNNFIKTNIPLLVGFVVLVVSIVIIYLVNGPARMGDVVYTPDYLVLTALALPQIVLGYLFQDIPAFFAAGSLFIFASYVIFFFVAPSSLTCLFLGSDPVNHSKFLAVRIILNFFVVLIAISVISFWTFTLLFEDTISFLLVPVLTSLLMIIIGNQVLIELYGFIASKNLFKKVTTTIFIFLGLFVSMAWFIYFPYHLQTVRADAVTIAEAFIQKLRSPNLDDLSFSEFNEFRTEIYTHTSNIDGLYTLWNNVMWGVQTGLEYGAEDYIESIESPYYASEEMRSADIAKNKRNLMGLLALQAAIREVETVCNGSVNIFEYTFSEGFGTPEIHTEDYKLLFIGEKQVQKNQLFNESIISTTKQGNIRICNQDISPLAQALFADNGKYFNWSQKFREDIDTLPEQEKIKTMTESYIDTLGVAGEDKSNRLEFKI